MTPTVLYAEDDSTIRGLVALVLAQTGLEVTSVDNAERALLALGARRFDLVLTDHRMAGVLTGLEVATAARRISADTAILVCSGSLDAQLCRRYREAGVDAFLPKPFGVAELVAIVLRLVSSRKLAEVAA